MKYQQLEYQWADFSQEILSFAKQLGFADLRLICDHVALRVNETKTAQMLLEKWKEKGEVISDSLINGRPIYIIALDVPLQLGEWKIQCVELPFPSKYYPKQGWEHIELVLPGNATTMAELELTLNTINPQIKAALTENPNIKIKRSEPKAQGERLANPTIAFKLNDICIKVHSADIKDVIVSENQNSLKTT